MSAIRDCPYEVPHLNDLAPVLTAVSTIDPSTQSIDGLITLNTVESKYRPPSVDVGVMSMEILIFIETASEWGLNLIVWVAQALLKFLLEDVFPYNSVPLPSIDVTCILNWPNTSPSRLP